MTGPWHPTGRARVNTKNPQAIGVCQRSGFWFQRAELVPQYEWEGVKLQNLELYVHKRYYDTPQQQLKTIVIPADPLPVYRPFPEDFNAANAGGPAAPLAFGPGPARPPAPGTADAWEALDDGPLPDLDKYQARGPARSGRVQARK